MQTVAWIYWHSKRLIWQNYVTDLSADEEDNIIHLKINYGSSSFLHPSSIVHLLYWIPPAWLWKQGLFCTPVRIQPVILLQAHLQEEGALKIEVMYRWRVSAWMDQGILALHHNLLPANTPSMCQCIDMCMYICSPIIFCLLQYVISKCWWKANGCCNGIYIHCKYSWLNKCHRTINDLNG